MVQFVAAPMVLHCPALDIYQRHRDSMEDLFRRKVLAEQNDEWVVGRRCLTPASITYNVAIPEVHLTQPTAA